MPSTRERRVAQRAQQFHALAEPTRLRILQLLRDSERCVCELTEALDLGQSLLSFHLRTLKETGLVKDRREGRWTYYALEENGLQELATLLKGLVAQPRRRLRNARRCD